MGGDPLLGLPFHERKHGITGPPDFESPGLLKIFTFEKQAGSAHGVQAAAGKDRRAMHQGAHPLPGFQDVFKCRLPFHALPLPFFAGL
jgi:hypothetical protein